MARAKTVIPESQRIDPKQLKLLADPVREFIVGALVPAARTVPDLAQELHCPPTRLYHHMKRLLAAKLIRVERTRMVSGIVERHFRATARQYLLDRTVFGRGKPDAGLDAILGFVFDQSRVEIAAAVARGRLDLTAPAGDARSVVAYRSSAWLTTAEAEAIQRDLKRLHDRVARLARRRHPAGSEPMSVTVAVFPTARPDENPTIPKRPATRRRSRS
jgi:hypothetical protein